MQPGLTLVLCVDRDDDIGFKGNVASPVVGRAACLRAANTLALADPEDSDVNAIFQAVKVYDELAAKGEAVEVAVVSGNHMNMLEGDRRIAAMVEKLVKDTAAAGCIVVTDGAEDEFVLPIVQSRVPVSGIQRVIVSQLPNLEGTYYLLKKFFNDPKVARLVLVPLGLLLLVYPIAYFLGQTGLALVIVVTAIGIFFLYRGLGIDDIFRGFADALRTSATRARFSFVTYIAGILLVIIGIVVGLMDILLYILLFVYGSVLWFGLAGIVASVGIVIDNYFHDRSSLSRVIVFPFFMAAVALISYGASTYAIAVSNVPNFPTDAASALSYILYGTIGGLIVAFSGIAIQHLINRYIEPEAPEIIELI
jgi:putative membrane protein